MLEIENFDEIIIANWKLYGSSSFIEEYLDQIKFYGSKSQGRCVIICPPSLYINQINYKNVFVGAQDCSAHIEGPYTGEISAKILKDIGCQFCIVGHSERRMLFNEDSQIVGKKILNCFQNNIIPIFCVGENLQQKKEKLTKDIIKEQIIKSLPNNANKKNIIIAYEPVWAIGSGLTPDLDEISKIHMFIKDNILKDKNVKILYGGSVKANNCKEILNLEGVDGLLVGGASLNIDEFNKIIGT